MKIYGLPFAAFVTAAISKLLVVVFGYLLVRVALHYGEASPALTDAMGWLFVAIAVLAAGLQTRRYQLHRRTWIRVTADEVTWASAPQAVELGATPSGTVPLSVIAAVDLPQDIHQLPVVGRVQLFRVRLTLTDGNAVDLPFLGGLNRKNSAQVYRLLDVLTAQPGLPPFDRSVPDA